MDCGEELPGLFAEADKMLMPFLKYCNIACGYHAGSTDTMIKTVQIAKEYGVLVGAHPSFNDRADFGRNYLDVPYTTLVKEISDQIAALNEILCSNDMKMFHVKVHGALYNAAMKMNKEAEALVDAVISINKDLVIFAIKGSTLENVAIQNGLKVLYETFADRNYEDVTTLVPRTQKNALVRGAQNIIDQIQTLNKGKIKLTSGETEDIASDTICLHGDHPDLFETIELLSSRTLE